MARQFHLLSHIYQFPNFIVDQTVDTQMDAKEILQNADKLQKSFEKQDDQLQKIVTQQNGILNIVNSQKINKFLQEQNLREEIHKKLQEEAQQIIKNLQAYMESLNNDDPQDNDQVNMSRSQYLNIHKIMTSLKALSSMVTKKLNKIKRSNQKLMNFNSRNKIQQIKLLPYQEPAQEIIKQIINFETRKQNIEEQQKFNKILKLLTTTGLKLPISPLQSINILDKYRKQNNKLILLKLAELYKKIENYDQYISILQQLCKLKIPQGYYQLGLIYGHGLKNKQQKIILNANQLKSIQLYKDAAELNYSKALYELAIVYARKNKKIQGQKYFQKAVQLYHPLACLQYGFQKLTQSNNNENIQNAMDLILSSYDLVTYQQKMLLIKKYLLKKYKNDKCLKIIIDFLRKLLKCAKSNQFSEIMVYLAMGIYNQQKQAANEQVYSLLQVSAHSFENQKAIGILGQLYSKGSGVIPKSPQKSVQYLKKVCGKKPRYLQIVEYCQNEIKQRESKGETRIKKFIVNLEEQL